MHTETRKIADERTIFPAAVRINAAVWTMVEQGMCRLMSAPYSPHHGTEQTRGAYTETNRVTAVLNSANEQRVGTRRNNSNAHTRSTGVRMPPTESKPADTRERIVGRETHHVHKQGRGRGGDG